jgi:sugar lactone lactonase YvrE
MAELASTVLADGRYFCEGPRWRAGRFWFSDFYAHEVCSIDVHGQLVTELSLGDEQPSGLGWLPDGRLLVVGMLKRQVLRRELDGSVEVHADLADIATFHANDMIVTPDGDAYVGNFGFDLDGLLLAEGEEGLLTRLFADPTPFMAKLAHVTVDGAVSVATSDVLFPNGMVLLDGGATLVVAQTLGMELTAFDRASDGALSNRRTWASLAQPDGTMIAPDGICADAQGGVWVANALAPQVVRVEEGGAISDTVATTQNAYACCLGGHDGCDLLVCTAPSSVHTLAEAQPLARLELVQL